MVYAQHLRCCAARHAGSSPAPGTMTPYEEETLSLTKINNALILLTLIAASYFGYQQNLINQQLVNANYEPSLSIQFAKPSTDSMSWLSIKNDGKTSVTYYMTEIGGTTSANDIEKVKTETINTKLFSVILPGTSIFLIKDSTGLIINRIMDNKNVDVNIPIYIFFKTGNGKKFIMNTRVRIFNTANGTQVDQGSVSYQEFNWKEI